VGAVARGGCVAQQVRLQQVLVLAHRETLVVVLAQHFAVQVVLLLGAFVDFHGARQPLRLPHLVSCHLVDAALRFGRPHRHLPLHEVVLLRGQEVDALRFLLHLALLLLDRVPVVTQRIHVGVGGPRALLHRLAQKAARRAHDVSVAASSVLVVVDGLGGNEAIRGEVTLGLAHLAMGNVFRVRLVHRGVPAVVKADVGVASRTIVGGVDAGSRCGLQNLRPTSTPSSFSQALMAAL